jgi:tetratricopeptide (TPR) repeat protein
MKTTSILIHMVAFSLSLALAQDVTSAPPIQGSSLLSQAASGNGREEQLYKDGTKYLQDSNWQQAVQSFSEAAAMKGRRADAALYWKAYSLNKAGRRAEAQSTIAELRRDFPRSGWLRDAGALELQIKQDTGQSVDPVAETDEDLKLLAINSLMNSDPERGVPLLQGVLSNPNNSINLKERALFVLAQSDSAQAAQVISAVARGQSGSDLQVRAIRYLGISGTRHLKLLQEIYAAASEASLKQAVLQAYMTSGAKEPVLAAATGEKDPELRSSAIHQLGAMGARDELEQLYKSVASTDDKESILQAFGVAGDTDALIRIATTEGDNKVRERAIRTLGPFGGEKARPVLVQIYTNEKDPQLRRTAIQSMFVLGDATDLIALARKETNPELKRRLVEQLSVMDSKEARDYMLEILNK